nr:ATP-dependent metallopeptidase FtsH/Yme1/Tma family protein [Sneathiella glossodoripedis]
MGRLSVNLFGKNLVLWVIIGMLAVILFNLFSDPGQRTAGQNLPYSQFLEKVDNGEIVAVTIQGQKITGQNDGGMNYSTYAPNDNSLVERLTERGVSITAAPVEEGSLLMATLLSWFPMLLLIGVWIFFMRQMQGGGGKAWGLANQKQNC